MCAPNFMYYLKYAPNGRNNIGGKLADVNQNCQSFQHVSLLGFLKFLLYLMPLVHQCLNQCTKYSKKFERSQEISHQKIIHVVYFYRVKLTDYIYNKNRSNRM